MPSDRSGADRGPKCCPDERNATAIGRVHARFRVEKLARATRLSSGDSAWTGQHPWPEIPTAVGERERETALLVQDPGVVHLVRVDPFQADDPAGARACHHAVAGVDADVADEVVRVVVEEDEVAGQRLSSGDLARLVVLPDGVCATEVDTDLLVDPLGVAAAVEACSGVTGSHVGDPACEAATLEDLGGGRRSGCRQGGRRRGRCRGARRSEADLADLAPGGRVHYAGGAQTGGRLQRPDERLGDRAEVSALWLNPSCCWRKSTAAPRSPICSVIAVRVSLPEALAARFLAFFAAFLAARFWAFLAAFLDFFEVTSSSSEAHVSGPTTPVLGIACLRWYF